MFVLLYNNNPNGDLPKKPPLPEEKNKELQISIIDTYLHKILRKSGIILKHAPEKCIAYKKAVQLALNIKYHIEEDDDYPGNVVQLYKDLEKECENIDIFKHYLFPNIIHAKHATGQRFESVSVMLMLMLSVPVMQPRLIDYLVHRTVYCADLRECGSCVHMVLECFSVINNTIMDGEEVITHLKELLGAIHDPEIKFQIITTIPGILEIEDMKKIIISLKHIIQNDNGLMNCVLDYILDTYIDECDYEKKIRLYLKKLINMS